MKKDKSYTIPIYRLQLVKEAEAEARPINGPQELADQMKDLAISDREQIVCLHLNTKNRPIGRQTVSIGTLNQTILSPREVFKCALLSNACSIILIHNLCRALHKLCYGKWLVMWRGFPRDPTKWLP